MKRHRPSRVTFLAVIALLVSLGNGLRLGETIYFWPTLAKYGAHPWYTAVSGGVWLAAAAYLTWGLWLGKAWAWTAAVGGAAGYGSWYWSDRLLLQQPHANWPFTLAFTAVCLAIIYFILFSHKTKQFFRRDAHERKPENPTPA